MVEEQLTFRPDKNYDLPVVVERHQNFPIDSNCYLITTRDSKECIVIDPAVEDVVAFYNDLLVRGLGVKYIILTHEHFDHIISVEYLRNASKCKVISTSICSDHITDPKKNLSLFHDQKGFSCRPSDILVTSNNLRLDWEMLSIIFYLTPGHTEGSLGFSIGNRLFTGDTIIKDAKTVTKLPGGNKAKLKESLNMLFSRFDNNTIVYPGHGSVFQLSETSIYSII